MYTIFCSILQQQHQTQNNKKKLYLGFIVRSKLRTKRILGQNWMKLVLEIRGKDLIGLDVIWRRRRGRKAWKEEMKELFSNDALNELSFSRNYSSFIGFEVERCLIFHDWLFTIHILEFSICYKFQFWGRLSLFEEKRESWLRNEVCEFSLFWFEVGLKKNRL